MWQTFEAIYMSIKIVSSISKSPYGRGTGALEVQKGTTSQRFFPQINKILKKNLDMLFIVIFM